MTAPLSPEALRLQEALNNAFTKLGEAFKEAAKPRYTMDEIRAALSVVCLEEFENRVEAELEKARKPL
jgi:hypothetical protein